MTRRRRKMRDSVVDEMRKMLMPDDVTRDDAMSERDDPRDACLFAASCCAARRSSRSTSRVARTRHDTLFERLPMRSASYALRHVCPSYNPRYVRALFANAKRMPMPSDVVTPR